MSNSHKSSLENAKNDKKKIKRGYKPPATNTMKYKIVDNRFHGVFYFRLKRRFLKKCREFRKIPDYETRFRFIPNYE